MKFVQSSNPFLTRSKTLSDLILVCKDGSTFAHQFVLSRNSRFLKKIFTQSVNVEKVELVESKLQGVPAKIKTDTHVGTRKLILLDYDLATVNILLDLLYKGEADSVGPLDKVSGKLSLSHLCQDLGFDHEFGGLPDIGDLEYVPCSPRKVKAEYFERIKDLNDNSVEKDVDESLEQNEDNKFSIDGDFSIASSEEHGNENDDHNVVNNERETEAREEVTEANKKIEFLVNELAECRQKIGISMETELSLKSNLEKEEERSKDLEKKCLVHREEKEILERKLEELETKLRDKEEELPLSEERFRELKANLDEVTEVLEEKNKQVKELKNKVEGFDLNASKLQELQEKTAQFKEISEQKDAKINKLSSSLIKEKQALLISEAKVKDLEGKVQQLKEIDVYKVNRSIEKKDLEIGQLKEDLAREQDNICYNNSVVGKLQTTLAEKLKLITQKDARIYELEQGQCNFSNKEASYKSANQQSLKRVQHLKSELLEESNKAKKIHKDYSSHLDEMRTVFHELLEKFHDIRSRVENDDIDDTLMEDMENFELSLQDSLDNIPEDDSPILVTVENRKRILSEDFSQSSNKASRRESTSESD